MPIITQEFGNKITQYEAKREEVNVAQAYEIARILPFILSEYSLSDVREWIRTGTVKELQRLRKENEELKTGLTRAGEKN